MTINLSSCGSNVFLPHKLHTDFSLSHKLHTDLACLPSSTPCCFTMSITLHSGAYLLGEAHCRGSGVGRSSWLAVFLTSVILQVFFPFFSSRNLCYRGKLLPPLVPAAEKKEFQESHYFLPLVSEFQSLDHQIRTVSLCIYFKYLQK